MATVTRNGSDYNIEGITREQFAFLYEFLNDNIDLNAPKGYELDRSLSLDDIQDDLFDEYLVIVQSEEDDE